MVEQGGQLLAQWSGLLCGSASVEFLKAWDAASSAAVGPLKSGQINQNRCLGGGN